MGIFTGNLREISRKYAHKVRELSYTGVLENVTMVKAHDFDVSVAVFYGTNKLHRVPKSFYTLSKLFPTVCTVFNIN